MRFFACRVVHPWLAQDQPGDILKGKRMKVGNVGSSKGIDRAKRKSGASAGSGSAFADQLRGASGASPTESVEPGIVDQTVLEGVDALLAMQEVGDSTQQEARKQAVRYGEDLLDRLKALQGALLSGAIPKQTLMEMAQRLRSGRVKYPDPRLNEILDEIELRVEVEIAKYARSA